MHMEQKKSDTNRKYLRTQLTGQVFGNYILALMIYVAALFAILAIGWSVSINISWRPSNIYYLLQWVKEWIIAIMLILILIGWIVITLRFMTRPLRYLDELVDASEKLANPGEEPIRLSRAMKSVEDELNLVREGALRNAMLAKEAEQRKNDLIVYLAHDLKTPLTSVIGYLTLLRDEPQISEEMRSRYTGIALDKAERLEDLINEFFDITRYNLQDIELEPVEINLSLMLEQIADELYGVLQDKNLCCEVEVEENLEVTGDPDKLARVFDNILRNAIAYCYAGTKIQIYAQKKEDDVEIVFSNEGDKIPGTMLQTIFEKFYRVDGSRSSGTGGAGLGLAIAKEIVELHGGHVRAKSNDQKTEFIVTLPSKKEQEEGEEDEVSAPRGHTFRGKSRPAKRTRREKKKGDLE